MDANRAHPPTPHPRGSPSPRSVRPRIVRFIRRWRLLAVETACRRARTGRERACCVRRRPLAALTGHDGRAGRPNRLRRRAALADAIARRGLGAASAPHCSSRLSPLASHLSSTVAIDRQSLSLSLSAGPSARAAASSLRRWLTLASPTDTRRRAHSPTSRPTLPAVGRALLFFASLVHSSLSHLFASTTSKYTY